MTSPAPLTPPDPADEPIPAVEEATDRAENTAEADWTPPWRRRRSGPAAEIAQGIRYLVATPLVLATFYLDAVSELFRESSGFLARLTHRLEGDPR